MHVCFCTDHNLVDEIPTVLESIVDHLASPQPPLHVHVIHTMLCPRQLHYLKTCCARHSDRVSLHLYEATWDKRYRGLKHITSATMLRILIPNLLETVERVIYLDIDVIVHCDLNDIYGMDCGKKGIALKTSLKQNNGCNPFTRSK